MLAALSSLRGGAFNVALAGLLELCQHLSDFLYMGTECALNYVCSVVGAWPRLPGGSRYLELPLRAADCPTNTHGVVRRPHIRTVGVPATRRCAPLRPHRSPSYSSHGGVLPSVIQPVRSTSPHSGACGKLTGYCHGGNRDMRGACSLLNNTSLKNICLDLISYPRW